MAVKLSERIARWLSPELSNQADRYWRMWHDADDVHKWCNGEARSVGQWLLERNHDHWRALDEPSIGKLPQTISDFRTWLYRQRDLPKSA
jgi:hypothetical protein